MSKMRIVVDLENDKWLDGQIRKKVIEALVGIERSEVAATMDAVVKDKLTRAGIDKIMSSVVTQKALDTARLLGAGYTRQGEELIKEVEILVRRNILETIDKFISEKKIASMVESLLQNRLNEMVQNAVAASISSGAIKIKVTS